MEVVKNKVTLLGMWASPYARWVKIALKVKGIPFDYVEENLKKKSQLLLDFNPTYKRVPVFVHEGNPIPESLIILEYIDETWKNSPQLLPQHPYSRSMVRFWADFLLNQLDMSLRKVITTQGTEEIKSIREVKIKLNILEENTKFIFPCDPPTNGEDMGMLDILFSTLPTIIEGIEEAFNLKLMEPEKYPLICSRMTTLNGLPVVKDTAPSNEKLIKFYQAYRRLYTHNAIPQ